MTRCSHSARPTSTRGGPVARPSPSFDVRDYRLDDPRGEIALVPQDTYLFNASVHHNPLVARPDASDEALHVTLERAGLSEFVATLPDGIDTKVGERGMQLSGGQRQRVSGARAAQGRPDPERAARPPGARGIEGRPHHGRDRRARGRAVGRAGDASRPARTWGTLRPSCVASAFRPTNAGRGIGGVGTARLRGEQQIGEHWSACATEPR
jgi:hypothetical protein